MVTLKNIFMISEVIKQRMEGIGLTQAKLSEAIDCTPTQLGLFLKNEASLNKNALDKCFKILGIPIETTMKRQELANKAATMLKGNSIELVASMSKDDMIRKTNIAEIAALPIVSKEEFELMVSSGVADYESTFQYFKALVLFFMHSPDKQTPKSAEKSLSALAAVLIAAPFMPFLGVGTVIGAAVGALAVKKSFMSKAVNTAWGPILTLAINIFDREDNKKS